MRFLGTSDWQLGMTRHFLSEGAQERFSQARFDAKGALRPIRAAVLLFAEEPSGLLDSKCSIRIFHYRGESIDYTSTPNLVRPPRTIGGPLIL
jgi:predicted HTH transcriptional regulator